MSGSITCVDVAAKSSTAPSSTFNNLLGALAPTVMSYAFTSNPQFAALMMLWQVTARTLPEPAVRLMNMLYIKKVGGSGFTPEQMDSASNMLRYLSAGLAAGGVALGSEKAQGLMTGLSAGVSLVGDALTFLSKKYCCGRCRNQAAPVAAPE